jgi:glycosyltransferase involved in cell wall biosynthesis
MTGRSRRILMTLDAVGGVWQYALGLAQQLQALGDFVVLAGVGPEPEPCDRREAEAFSTLEWLASPPDWLAADEQAVAGLGDELDRLVRGYAIDLVQVNEPGQAAHLELSCPLVAVSHSCIATWFQAVRGTPPPNEWTWQQGRTGVGLKRADLVVAPSFSHRGALRACYGLLPRLAVVYNAATNFAPSGNRNDTVFAAGRWWDEGKNGHVLDQAAALVEWSVLAAGATVGPNGSCMTFENLIALGPITHAEVLSLAGRSGLFVSPSLYEPFGLGALEAAAAGTPLLLADIPTYRELWGDVAAFFAPRDHQALAAQINRLTQDEALRRRMGAAARQRARRLTYQRQAVSMRRAYDSVEAVRIGRS